MFPLPLRLVVFVPGFADGPRVHPKVSYVHTEVRAVHGLIVLHLFESSTEAPGIHEHVVISLYIKLAIPALARVCTGAERKQGGGYVGGGGGSGEGVGGRAEQGGGGVGQGAENSRHAHALESKVFIGIPHA